jgi:YcaO-like protein with predicted kinase domain
MAATCLPPPRPRAGRHARLARLRRALGVTRVARVTGLDRAGVEVACAVRPGGHVLQVTNGKGLSFADAEAGALLEAAELAAAECLSPADLRWASVDELLQRGVPCLPPASLGGGCVGGAPLAWRRGRDLLAGGQVLVPAAALHVPPQGGPLLGLAGLQWTSNGMGAHPSPRRALLHALLEAVERDAVARSLPHGFTAREIAARLVSPSLLRRRAPAAAALVARVERDGFQAYLFDLAPRDSTGPPVAGALLLDRRRGPVPLTAGYACRPDAASAAVAALLEAAQSRLTDIHGAREDVSHAAEGGGAEGRQVDRIARACARAAEAAPGAAHRRPGAAWSVPAGDPARAIDGILRHLRAAGHRRCAAVDLGWPELGVAVVKVLVPGLLLSPLL